MTRYIDVPPQQRPAMQSEANFVTETQQLLRQQVHVAVSDNAGFIADTMIWGASDVTFYHGTTAWAAYRIIRGGGFFPGVNGHTKKRRHYRGCFGSTFFDVAALRGDPTRHLAEDNIYTFASCPCTLELQASSAHLVRYHRHSKPLFVLPGQEGQVLPGIRVKVVWWNAMRVHNFACLTFLPDVRAVVRQRGGIKALCGGGRQWQDFQCCGKAIHNLWEPPVPGITSESEKVGKFWL